MGGNLSLLQTITGTASQASFVGRILFLEDLDEYLYHVDCVLLHLHRNGQLAGLAGLVVGYFSAMRATWEVIDRFAQMCDFPVAYSFPTGHEADNLALGRPESNTNGGC